MQVKKQLLMASGVALLWACSKPAAPIDGRWDATLTVNQAPVPFRFDLATTGENATGTLFDGDQHVGSTRGSYRNGKLQLHFDAYDSDLAADARAGQLTGKYTRHYGKRDRVFPFSAKPYRAPQFTSAAPAAVAGLWRLASADGKQIWTLQLNQQDHSLTGAILRLDGDTGALSGSVDANAFALSHFSGARPTLIEGTYQPGTGTLAITVDREDHFSGVRESEAEQNKLAPPPDPFGSTKVKDPARPFEFRFPDHTGRIFTASDFRGHPLIISIGGTWCPNCMDEAPFLVDLYRRYHPLGLEIVGLNFETGDEAYNRKRVQSFIERFGIPYPILITGPPDDAAKILPQLVNFAAFPTTIFVGKDSLVKGIHDGFASVATGAEHEKLKAETNGIVERLLGGTGIQPARRLKTAGSPQP
jgi:thiol-disulfide isomerase/thioredoxin